MEKEKIYNILNEAYFSDNMHEKKVIKQLPDLLKSKKVFIDIGASLGQYTYFANKILESASIIAIEADPVRYEKLKENCTKWQEESSNKIKAIFAAASDIDGENKFFTTGTDVSGGLFKHNLDNINEDKKKLIEWKELSVKTLRLDTLLYENLPSLIKIDVEGSELRVLKGCLKLIEGGLSTFLIEVHPWSDPDGQKDKADVYNYLKKFGYRSYPYYGKTLFLKSSFLSNVMFTIKKMIINNFKK